VDLPGPTAAAVRCVAAAVALALPGCGASAGGVPVGAKVFDQACQTCHSLAGNDSLRRVGGDLLGYRLSRTQVLELVRQMPVRRVLSPAEIAAVSDYVLGRERRAAGRCPAPGC
jgi:mono/diheme cytochrome c family protein